MKTNTLRKLFSPVLICFALLCCAAKASVAPVAVPLGDNTFSITRQAGSAFARDTDKLKALVQEDAAKYCADQGKQLRVVALTAEKPPISFGYISARIVFKAVTPGEPEPVAPSRRTRGG